MLRNTTKPITFWYHDRNSATYINEIMIALRGSEKAAMEYPLCYPFQGIDLLYETARLNLPVPIGPMAQMGLSAPCSIADTMAVENAEILAGVCITQLIRPGMPVCYGGICHAFDMRTTPESLAILRKAKYMRKFKSLGYISLLVLGLSKVIFAESPLWGTALSKFKSEFCSAKIRGPAVNRNAYVQHALVDKGQG